MKKYLLDGVPKTFSEIVAFTIHKYGYSPACSIKSMAETKEILIANGHTMEKNNANS